MMSIKNTDTLSEKTETDIVKLLSKFPSVIEDSVRDYKPHYIANYLFSLASKFNEYYHNTKIIGSDHESQRLALVSSFAIVMTIGLKLLGIDVPKRM